MSPETAIGQIMGSVCCLVGTLVIALPVPILEMKMKLVQKKPAGEENNEEQNGGQDGEAWLNSWLFTTLKVQSHFSRSFSAFFEKNQAWDCFHDQLLRINHPYYWDTLNVEKSFLENS